MAQPSSRSRQAAPLSLEASLDEENRQVLAALDRPRPRSPALKSDSRSNTPPPVVRSMLDVPDTPGTPRHGSIAGIGVGITSPKQHRKDSGLDPSDPSTWTSPHSSKPNSPTLTRAELKPNRPRGGSDVIPATSGYVGLPRVQPGSRRTFEDDYQFDISSIPTTGSGTAKTPAESQRPREGSGGGAMAAALSGDFSNLHVGRPLTKSSSKGSSGSRSPSGRVKSPKASSSGHLSPSSPPAKLRTAQGTVVDENAHRRLSNKSKSSSFSTMTDESEGSSRVPTDQPPGEDAIDSSGEEHWSGDDDEERGRDRDRASTDEIGATETGTPKADEAENRNTSPMDEKKHAVPHSQVIKSMLEPSISVTTPSGEKMPEPSSGVHPQSNFDNRRMSTSTQSVGSDADDDDAIAKAKSLGLIISPLDTKVEDRHVRMIIRGNWVRFQKESQAGTRHLRTYLACSDLSVEATYALEWTVGTIMRDGDTLLAIYAIEDETAGAPNKNKQTEAEKEKLHQEGAQAGKEANDAMTQLTRQTTKDGDQVQFKFTPATEAQTATGSVDGRKVGKKEMDRLKAIDEITQTFLRLVRKTTLQVRCMIEVIHCQSPKHLILGAIDEIEPTLTIVGTRGRSSLQGVLLGSFSNYLVTKSSAPVMVARRRLKKPKSQVRIGSNKIRLSNNLIASAKPGSRRSLTQARID